MTLDFTNTGTIFDDLYQEMQHSQIETVQTVYIDNSQNAAPFNLQLLDTQQIITAQPFTQGVYPVITGSGGLKYKATTTQGIKIPIIFSNCEKNYAVWGPVPGVTVVPVLTNIAFQPTALVNGNQNLVAGVANQTVKFYRGIFIVDQPTTLKWTDGNGGTVLFSATLTAGGSITFQPSGIPWFVNSAGNALVLNSSAVCNLSGGMGFVQS